MDEHSRYGCSRQIEPVEGYLSAWKCWLYSRRKALLCYALAPAAVAIAFLLRLALAPALGDDARYLLFVPAVLVAAGLGGLGPGLTATGLGAVLGFFLTTASPTDSMTEVVNAVVFVLIGAGISWSGEQLQRTRVRAAASTRETRCPRGASHIDSRYRAGRDDRHR